MPSIIPSQKYKKNLSFLIIRKDGSTMEQNTRVSFWHMWEADSSLSKCGGLKGFGYLVWATDVVVESVRRGSKCKN